MSSGPPANQDELIASLASLTGLAPTEAEQYLAAADWNLEHAGALYFDDAAPQDEQDATSANDPTSRSNMADDNETQTPEQQQPGGGRTLGGAYVPPTESGSSSAQQPAAQRQPQRGVAGLRTLGDLQSSGGGGHGHAHDDDDSDDDDEQHDFFTGGEKSGLAVQNPNQSNPRDHINNILRRARQNAPRPGGDEEESATQFRGTGMTLGGDDAPSRAIPDPTASAPSLPPRAHRELHLWRDGFSVDDGDLFRYDDPANARTLEMINTGHAPLHILNVEQGQEVDVEVHAHKDEDYIKPKKKWAPFSGSGQRLGSPTPGASWSAPPPAPAASSSGSTAAAGTTETAKPTVNVDSSAPVITLQIRLADGTRLPSRFNTTHTIGDVYDFVNSASAASTQRPYALITTFPSRELSDKAQALGDLAEFKRGGVVVQKWT
ncbi:Cdc48-dependent protein degradation adaptor protein-like protein [Karstenula rhodostoma CBS 690.94]|uniref:Cdc48-dependent protein degradation adaptor protein-like protein n=1 Tax=Karstenula rhodostoma CBS 690.94 TaxID=1392251 RepID=A0A9P4PPA8_9PLEO|nr:Cdc48-dependent protein degradation adaptor protein-like protein [Karstenula rhodostoma CBS 690.94]